MDRRSFVRIAGAGAGLGLVRKVAEAAGGSGAPWAADGPRSASLPTRILGKTGERVPILGLGTAGMGRTVPDGEAIALVNEAIDLGVTYLDTAPELGGYGRAQLQIGEVMRERRDEVFLVSKCWVPRGEDARRLLEESLRELKTDHVDLAYTHSLGADRMDPEVVFSEEGTIRALARAKEEGLARFVGISGHNRPHRFVEALERFDVDVVMTAVNPADRYVYGFEETVWPRAREEGVGLVAMKVYAGPSRGATPARLAPEHQEDGLRYALSLDGAATAVVGMVSRAELRENVERARRFTPLTPEEEERLLELGRGLAGEWGARFGPVR